MIRTILKTLRVRRDLLKHPVLRGVARRAVQKQWIAFQDVCGSYFGTFAFQFHGLNMKYVLTPRDSVGELLFWNGAERYETEVLTVFLEYARTARGVLDIGANTGLFSLLACAAQPQAKVIAWEPVPYLNEKLRANISVNGFTPRCQTRGTAASDHCGTAQLFVPEDTTMATLNSNFITPESTIEIQTETVDSFLNEEFCVDLVKIDVETHEYSVLLGMKDLIQRWNPVILFECLPGRASDNIFHLLKASRYQVFGLTEAGKFLVSDLSSHAGVNSNFLAVPQT